jgi:hypothetical protein
MVIFPLCDLDLPLTFWINHNIWLVLAICKKMSTIPVAADAPTIAAVLSVDFEGIGSDVVVAI